ncbi:MAG: MATE family efflux transporter [Phycisphaerales bacterium]|nr:MATE family efflux transporter [Phycisphaerales bacterium]
MNATLPDPGRPPGGSPLGELLRLAAPMIGVTLSRMLMGFIDFAMVSQLGTSAQAAISPTTLLLFTVACAFMGAAQAAQTFVSQAVGRGEPHRAGAYAWQTQYLALFGALATAPLAITTPQWFPWVADLGKHAPDVTALEIEYLTIGLWSIGLMTASAGLEGFYNGIRRPGVCLTAVIASLVTNAVGNYLLIFGKFGAPEMGMRGAALATVLAWGVRLAVLLLPLASRAIDEVYHTRRSVRFDAGRFAELMRMGAPIALQWLVDIGAWIVFLVLLMPHYGTVALAASNLAIQFMHLSFMPALGIGMALSTQVGNAIGAGRPEVAAMRMRVALGIVMGYMGVMGLLFLLLGAPLAATLCFEEDEALRGEVVRTAAGMLLWCALFQISDGVCIVYSFAFRGAGDTRVPALLFAICCWGIFVGGGLLIVWFMPALGTHGLWAVCSLYIIVLGVLLWMRYRSGAWHRKTVFETPAPVAASA